MNRTLPTALVVLLALPASASALTHAAPADGASVATSHPTFTWAPNSGEHAQSIEVSRTGRTTPGGEFYDEDRVTGDYFTSPYPTSWAPTSAVAAGSYWWNVAWTADDYSTSGYTAPWSFIIPARVQAVRVAVTQYSNLDDAYVKVSWWSNVSAVTGVCKVMRGRKTISRRRFSDTYLSIEGRNDASCYVRVPERLDGTRLRAVATVTGGGLARTVSRTFRAK